MSFSIDFTDKVVPSEWLGPDEKASFAEITINDFSEMLLVPLDYWTKQDYQKYWASELNSFINSLSDIAVLLVEMYEPAHANFFKAWVLYRQADRIVVTNNLVLPNEGSSLSLDNLHSLIPEFDEYSDDGDRISVWNTTISEIRDWLKALDQSV